MVKGLTYLICVALAASWTSVLADKCDTYVHPTYGVGKCVNTARCPNSLYVSSLCENYPNDVKCCFNTPTEDCSTYSHPQYGKGKCVKVSACSSSSQLSLRGYCDGMASDYTCCFDKTTTPAPTAPLRSCGISETKGKGVCVKSNICPNGNIASAAASSPCDLGADEVCCYSLQGNLDYYEFRGVWVSTVANIDFPTKRTLTTEQQKAELLKIVETVQAIGLNAIVFQVRPAGDALYKSNYEPWSVYLTGTQGKAPSPEWDPLAFIIEEGHKRNIDIHAWLNPYRGRSKGESYTLASNHMAKRFPNYAYNFDGYVLMDPSSEEVRQHTLNVVEDIVSRYDVDGVHIDDYFYPYPVDGVVFPDDGPYNTYKAQGGTLGKSDWRRENVNRLVKALYEKVKSIKPLVQFGVAPFGIWRPGNPPGITGFDAYEGLYGDSKKWLENGWLDYFTPQLYWATFSTGQNFTKLLDWWCDKAQNKMGKLIYAGTAVYKMKDNGWAASEIINQIQTTRNAHVSGAYGATHFTMNYFLSDYKGIATEMKKVYSKPALTPLIAAKN